MIAGPSPHAVEIGREVHAKGGNVVDAMSAVSFALGVVEPAGAGIPADRAGDAIGGGAPRAIVLEAQRLLDALEIPWLRLEHPDLPAEPFAVAP